MTQARDCVLLYGFAARPSELQTRIRQLGYEVVIESEARAAVARISGPRPLRAVVLPADFALPERGGELDHLQRAAGGFGLCFVAVGPRPGSGVEFQLRQKQVRLCLWSPFHDRELRFVLNRALHDPAPGTPDAGQGETRRDLRVPTELAAQVRIGGREKPGRIYSLSPGGCFLETKRPSLVGGALEVVLPLPRGALQLAGRVILTNVPGNLQRPNLPCGMGIEFQRLTPDAREALLDFIRERARAYEI